MSESKNLGSFLSDNKALVKEYLETRVEIYRLQILRVFARSAGFFAWILISLFLILLFLFFGGMMIGFWFSGMLHSYVKGFGLTAVLVLVVFLLLTAFRKALFINPIIQEVLHRSRDWGETAGEDEE